jgi:hypothetical protein
VAVDVRQTEINTADPLVPQPSKLKSYKSPGIDQIPAELKKGVDQFAVR